MKRILLILLIVAMSLSATVGYATDFSFLDDMTLEELQEIREEVDGRITELRKEAVDDSDTVEATRTNPALVGQTVICQASSYLEECKISLQITRSIRGAAANALLKSFNKYNTRSLEKGTEWFIVMLKIEALESEEEKIDMNDYYFHFVSSDGVEYTDRYISDNPAEVKSLYVGSTQYAWFASKVKIGDYPLLTYDRSSDSIVWFNPNERIAVDTSDAPYDPLKSKDTGEAVEELQYRLMEYGLFTSAPSGKYDSATTKAVKSFQKAFGLSQSGTADEETQRILFSGKPLPE